MESACLWCICCKCIFWCSRQINGDSRRTVADCWLRARLWLTQISLECIYCTSWEISFDNMICQTETELAHQVLATKIERERVIMNKCLIFNITPSFRSESCIDCIPGILYHAIIMTWSYCKLLWWNVKLLFLLHFRNDQIIFRCAIKWLKFWQGHWVSPLLQMLAPVK